MVPPLSWAVAGAQVYGDGSFAASKPTRAHVAHPLALRPLLKNPYARIRLVRSVPPYRDGQARPRLLRVNKVAPKQALKGLLRAHQLRKRKVLAHLLQAQIP